ncbi:MAG: DHHA2 domain-containing protein, partial [Boseongicola sp.]
DSVDQVLFFLIDILNEEALFFIPNDLVRSVAEKSFGITAKGDLASLPGVVSRKKQIIPALKV